MCLAGSHPIATVLERDKPSLVAVDHDGHFDKAADALDIFDARNCVACLFQVCCSDGDFVAGPAEEGHSRISRCGRRGEQRRHGDDEPDT